MNKTKTIVITLGNDASRPKVIKAVKNLLECSLTEAADLVKDTSEITFDADKWNPDYIRGVFENLNCTVRFKRKSKPETLKSTATFYEENGYAEFSTFFRVKFTKNANVVIVKNATEDIIGTFGDVIIRALELRMDSCVSMLMRNCDKVTFANEHCIQFKKANGQLHTFNRESFVYMKSAITMLQEGRIGEIIKTPGICRQIAKALYWIPEEDKRERNGIGFGRLVSTMISLC